MNCTRDISNARHRDDMGPSNEAAARLGATGSAAAAAAAAAEVEARRRREIQFTLAS